MRISVSRQIRVGSLSRAPRSSLRHGRLVVVVLTLAMALLSGCVFQGVTHQDYGDCTRRGRHVHNDHVFLGDYHDHALCEWLKYE